MYTAKEAKQMADEFKKAEIAKLFEKTENDIVERAKNGQYDYYLESENISTLEALKLYLESLGYTCKICKTTWSNCIVNSLYVSWE